MDTFNRSGLKFSTRRNPKAAFSLVEVTLAIGIFAFAMTAIVGLLPLGLSTFRQAMDASIGSEICQKVTNDVQQTDFNTLTTNPNPGAGNLVPPFALALRYFDDQGDEVDRVKTPLANYLYEVNTIVGGVTYLPAGTPADSPAPTPTLPSSFNNVDLVTVLIQIAKNPYNKTIATNSTNPLVWNDPNFAISSYSAFISRNQAPTPSPSP